MRSSPASAHDDALAWLREIRRNLSAESNRDSIQRPIGSGTKGARTCEVIMTTLRGADAALRAIKSLQKNQVSVRALQEYHG